MDKIVAENIEITKQLENPKKTALRELLVNYYKKMRSDFTTEVEHYY